MGIDDWRVEGLLLWKAGVPENVLQSGLGMKCGIEFGYDFDVESGIEGEGSGKSMHAEVSEYGIEVKRYYWWLHKLQLRSHNRKSGEKLHFKHVNDLAKDWNILIGGRMSENFWGVVEGEYLAVRDLNAVVHLQKRRLRKKDEHGVIRVAYAKKDVPSDAAAAESTRSGLESFARESQSPSRTAAYTAQLHKSRGFRDNIEAHSSRPNDQNYGSASSDTNRIPEDNRVRSVAGEEEPIWEEWINFEERGCESPGSPDKLPVVGYSQSRTPDPSPLNISSKTGYSYPPGISDNAILAQSMTGPTCDPQLLPTLRISEVVGDGSSPDFSGIQQPRPLLVVLVLVPHHLVAPPAQPTPIRPQRMGSTIETKAKSQFHELNPLQMDYSTGDTNISSIVKHEKHTNATGPGAAKASRA
ncbi:uncharacterized protein BDR25DRAFT_312884 [Lindgomyces ingoldianus]|uniref:Uncharacterized protein n=1 Tax=Lindgomyces ingoldianus TaxID=673940 RepID=A0ACB6QZ33_9PLEO|nr:uncharacterized protein BDR25DRAFT_312884 [Lindgomyces ingoldianus]KAF2472324.1 hypothetical protein BDR25DRAFT_312884 [Lindgomyces ingoldianus]